MEDILIVVRVLPTFKYTSAPASYIRRNYVKIQLGGEHPHLSR